MNPFTRRTFISAAAAMGMAQKIQPSTSFDPMPASGDLTLWYQKPAARWVDALPIGNGRLGGMLFGGGQDGSPAKEWLQFNEDTLWSGKPQDGNKPGAAQFLPEIRRAVLVDQNYHAADELCTKMQGLFAEAYHPLAYLRLEFLHNGATTNYRRELNLDTVVPKILISGRCQLCATSFCVGSGPGDCFECESE